MKPLVQNVLKRHLNVSRYLRLMHRTLHSLKTRGFKDTGTKIVHRVRQKAGFPVQPVLALDPFKNRPSKQELRRQKNWSAEPGYRPDFQIVLPLEGHSRKAILSTVRSLRSQSYPHWTLLIIADPESKRSGTLLEQLKKADPRIQVLNAGNGCSPQESLDLIQNIASGGYLGLVHEGDKLTADALFEVASAIEQQPELDVVYTDEAVLTPKGNRLERLVLKPDWSPDMLLGYNYLGGLSVFRRSTFERLGGFDPKYGKAQAWDLGLKFLEHDGNFKRVPRCCYLRKAGAGANPWGTANPENAADSIQVVKDYLDRQGLAGDVNVRENGTLRIRWRLTEEPLVSIVIPNKNSPELIRAIVSDLLHKTSYANKEIIIVDNQSTDPAVREFYREQEAAGSIRVVPFDREFNYSAACNAGARAAAGELLLFLNNDMEVVSPDWLGEMVGWTNHRGVGVVGAKLLYPRGSLQHAGVVLGLYFVSHLWHKVSTREWGVFGTSESYRNFLAITGACQLVKRSVFDEVGGFDEAYRIAYSDIALCLKAWNLGQRVVYTPHAELIHYEQYTRGDTTPLPDLEIMAQEVREWNLREDPFFHPGLSASSFQPKPRLAGEQTPSEMLRAYVEHHSPVGDSFVPVDLFDEEEVRQTAAAWSVRISPPKYSPVEVPEETNEAAKFVLHVLLKHKEIRARFPRALSEGADGEYCRWLCEEGLRQFRISPAAAESIRKAFRSQPGIQIRKLYSFRPELRHAHPTALLPTGQKRFLHWLLTTNAVEHGFRDEEIWWFFLEAAEDPLREFEFTYRISQEWQKTFPAGLTAFGNAKLIAWLKRRHRLDDELLGQIEAKYQSISADGIRFAYVNKPDWQYRFPKAYQSPAETREFLNWVRSQAGPAALAEPVPIEPAGGKALALNVLGHFCYPSGLQQSVRSIVRSLEAEGVDLALRDVPAHYVFDDPDRSGFLDLEPYDVSLIHVQPMPHYEEPYFDTVYRQAGLEPRKGVYRIGIWYWELEDVPFTWPKASLTLEELWAPTRFIAEAMKKTLSLPVTPMLPGVEVGKIESVPRSELGVADDEYLFLFMFDMKSMMERKNPLGLIEAYRQAFSRDDKAKLIIKVSSGSANPDELVRLEAAAAEAGVLLIDEVLSREKSYGLIEACDCYISLHRSEGLGLTMAEAMLMAKPVIATNYSGNVDFMDESVSLLVDYELRRLEGTCPDYVYNIYGDKSRWAHPSTAHAAKCMRWVYENQAEAKAMGLRAKAHAGQVLSPKAAGERLKRRLEEIYQDLGQETQTNPLRRAA